jgi:hypothetical protein
MSLYKIIDVNRTESGVVTEPVNIDDVKRWLRVTFNDDDSVITSLIKSCRESVEEYCSISLVNKDIVFDVELQYENSRSCFTEIELPYGPIIPSGIQVVSLDFNHEYNSLDNGSDYWFVGSEYLKLRTRVPLSCRVVYSAGMSNIPESLKNAILIDIADKYENRGDNAGDSAPVLCDKAKQKAKPYKRMTWQ